MSDRCAELVLELLRAMRGDMVEIKRRLDLVEA